MTDTEWREDEVARVLGIDKYRKPDVYDRIDRYVVPVLNVISMFMAVFAGALILFLLVIILHKNFPNSAFAYGINSVARYICKDDFDCGFKPLTIEERERFEQLTKRN